MRLVPAHAAIHASASAHAALNATVDALEALVTLADESTAAIGRAIQRNLSASAVTRAVTNAVAVVNCDDKQMQR